MGDKNVSLLSTLTEKHPTKLLDDDELASNMEESSDLNSTNSSLETANNFSAEACSVKIKNYASDTLQKNGKKQLIFF